MTQNAQREIRPAANEHAEYQQNYLAHVQDGDILETLHSQETAIFDFINAIPADQAETIHPPYGWTIRQVIEHCVDAERVFGYRVLRFGAGDSTELPGWSENDYAAANYGPNCGLSELADEYRSLRSANIALLSRLAPAAWNHVGKADGNTVSCRALAWLMAGHWMHHEKILRQRLGWAEPA